MFSNLISWYFTILLMVFSFWLTLFFQDVTTPKNHLISWIILLTGSLFWPVVLPISSWELMTKVSNRRLI